MLSKSKSLLLCGVAVSCLMPLTAAAQTFTSTDTPLPIVDNTATISTINVPAVGTITDVDVSVTGFHTWAGDLNISVTSPNATIVTLMNNEFTGGGCGNSNDLAGTYVFDDDAATSITSSGMAPGTYTTSTNGGDPLANFNGEQANGNWTLTVDDQCSGDTGTLSSWSLILMLGAINQAYSAPTMPFVMAGDADFLLGRLEDRKLAIVEDPQQNTFGFDGTVYDGGKDANFWMRAGAEQEHAEAGISNLFFDDSADIGTSRQFYQMGVSANIMSGGPGVLVASAFGHYSASKTWVENGAGAHMGHYDSRGWGAGASLTWLGDNGFYADAVGLANWTQIDVDQATGSSGDTDATVLAGALEAGQRIPVSATLTVIPQAQITLQSVDIDSYTESDGTRMEFDTQTFSTGRIGIGVEKIARNGSGNTVLNASAHYQAGFGDDSTATVNGTELGFSPATEALLLSAGFTTQGHGGGWKAGLQVNYLHGLGSGSYESLGATGKLTLTW